MADGCRWVVAMDLDKFFDQVNHNVLMARGGQVGERQGGATADPVLSAGGNDARRELIPIFLLDGKNVKKLQN